MTRCESYPPCFGTIYFPTAPFLLFGEIKTILQRIAVIVPGHPGSCIC